MENLVKGVVCLLVGLIMMSYVYDSIKKEDEEDK